MRRFSSEKRSAWLGLGAVAVACLFRVDVVAAAPDCGERPQTPVIPNGAEAQIEDMKSASKAVEEFADQMNTYADCLIDSAQTAIDARNDIVQRWNNEIDIFNSRLTSE